MIEKVNPCHPDKVADRIAGAIVDRAYMIQHNPKVAVEVLIGHGECNIIIESSVVFDEDSIQEIVEDIVESDTIAVRIKQVPQDIELAKNQERKIRCGDNGIFKGMPLTNEQKELSKIVREIYRGYPFDGKYILDGKRLIICQSNVNTETLKKIYPNAIINPLGEKTYQKQMLV